MIIISIVTVIIIEVNCMYSSYCPSSSSLRGHTDAVLCLQFDNEKIVSGSKDTTIKVLHHVVCHHQPTSSCCLLGIVAKRRPVSPDPTRSPRGGHMSAV